MSSRGGRQAATGRALVAVPGPPSWLRPDRTTAPEPKHPRSHALARSARPSSRRTNRPWPPSWPMVGYSSTAARCVNPAAMVLAGELARGHATTWRCGARRSSEFALEAFGVDVDGRVCARRRCGRRRRLRDRAPRAPGAARVPRSTSGTASLPVEPAVDERVVSLERTNIARRSTPSLMPDPVDVVTLDLSYLALGPSGRRSSSRITLGPPGRISSRWSSRCSSCALPAPPTRSRAARCGAGRRCVTASRQPARTVIADAPSPVTGSTGARGVPRPRRPLISPVRHEIRRYIRAAPAWSGLLDATCPVATHAGRRHGDGHA